MPAARRRPVFLLLALLAAGLAAASTPSAQAAVSCDRFASPSGGDTAAGTATAPLRTARKLVESLTAGQTGCLLPGTYTEDLTIRNGGAPGAPITLAAGPQGGAKLVGRLWISDQANDVVVRDLTIDGRSASNLPSPTVNGDRVSFIANDVSNANTTICFVIGSVTGYGLAYNVLLEGNRIHNCGILPAQNHHHGIYLEGARDGVIRGNYIFDNADKGILIFPDSDGNLIERNVIDGNTTGILIGGSMLADAWHAVYPKDNIIRRNVITNSRRYNVEGYWEWQPPADVNNVVTDNCLFGAGFGVQVQDPLQVSVWGAGFSATANRVADPVFVSRAAKNFALAANSGCAGFGPEAAASAPAPAPAPAPVPVPVPTPVPVPVPVPVPGPAVPVPVPPPGTKPVPPPTPAPKPKKKPKHPRHVQSVAANPLRITFAERPTIVEPGRLAVQVASTPSARVVLVVRMSGRVLAVVNTRAGSRGGVHRVIVIPRGQATRLHVTATVRRDGRLRRTTVAVRLTPREVRFLAARR